MYELHPTGEYLRLRRCPRRCGSRCARSVVVDKIRADASHFQRHPYDKAGSGCSTSLSTLYSKQNVASLAPRAVALSVRVLSLMLHNGTPCPFSLLERYRWYLQLIDLSPPAG